LLNSPLPLTEKPNAKNTPALRRKKYTKKILDLFYLLNSPLPLTKKFNAQTHITKQAHNSQPTTMDNERNPSHGQSGNNDGKGDNNDRRGGNNDRRGGNNDGRRGSDATPGRRSKRHTTTTPGTVPKKQKGMTAETPIGTKQNDGNDDNASSQGDAMDEKAAEEGVSAENNSDASDNVINNTPVRKLGFSYPEKHVLQYITNTPPFFAVNRTLNLKTITPWHKAVLKKRRTVLLT